MRWSSSRFTFTHAKTIVIDRSEALILTLNLSKSAFESNREFGLITTRPADVASAEAIFEADWADRATNDVGPLTVSPSNSRGGDH